MKSLSHKDTFFLILIGVVVAILAIAISMYKPGSKPAGLPAPPPNRQSTTIVSVSHDSQIPAALADMISDRVFASQSGKIVQAQTRALSNGAEQSVLVYSSKLSLSAAGGYFNNYFKINKGSVSSGNATANQFSLGVTLGDKTYSVFVLPNGTGSTVSVSVIQAK